MKKIIIAICLLTSSIFSANGDATGSVNKIIFTNAFTTVTNINGNIISNNTQSAIFFEVSCGSGCVATYWLDHNEKDGLSIVLSAKSMGVNVSVTSSTTADGMIKLNGVYCNHANQIIMP